MTCNKCFLNHKGIQNMQCGNSFSTSPPLISLLLINDVPTLLSGKCPISLDYYFEMSLQVVSINALHQKFKDSLGVAQKTSPNFTKGLSFKHFGFLQMARLDRKYTEWYIEQRRRCYLIRQEEPARGIFSSAAMIVTK
mgnify:CR=1 FL=1